MFDQILELVIEAFSTPAHGGAEVAAHAGIIFTTILVGGLIVFLAAYTSIKTIVGTVGVISRRRERRDQLRSSLDFSSLLANLRSDRLSSEQKWSLIARLHDNHCYNRETAIWLVLWLHNHDCAAYAHANQATKDRLTQIISAAYGASYRSSFDEFLGGSKRTNKHLVRPVVHGVVEVYTIGSVSGTTYGYKKHLAGMLAEKYDGGEIVCFDTQPAVMKTISFMADRYAEMYSLRA